MQIVETQIHDYISRHYTVLPPLIQPYHRFQQDLGLSEWEFMDVLVYLEHFFEVDLPNELLDQQLTVAQLSQLIFLYSRTMSQPTRKEFIGSLN